VSTVSSSLSYAVWGVILLGGLVLWWVSLSHQEVARPSDALGRVAVHPVFRVVVVLVFMWFGWHLFAR
jgi:hypothetical protein